MLPQGRKLLLLVNWNLKMGLDPKGSKLNSKGYTIIAHNSAGQILLNVFSIRYPCCHQFINLCKKDTL